MPTADSSSPEASDYAVKLKRIMQSFEHTPAFDPSHVLKKSLFKYEDAQVSELDVFGWKFCEEPIVPTPDPQTFSDRLSDFDARI